MGLETIRGVLSRFLILALAVGIFTIVASAQGYCDIQFNGGLHTIELPPMINVSPNPVYVGQTVTVTGSGWNTTAYPGDPYPIVACSLGTPTRINADGTWVIQTSFTGPGTHQVYAQDKWGHTSNTVNLTIVTPPAVTFKGTVYNGSTSTLCTNGGSIYVKYPASMTGHYEENFFGSTYISTYPYNGTTAEVWAVRGTLKSEHLTIDNIQPGQTYTFNLILPTPTPAAVATPTASPTSEPSATQSPQVTATPGQTQGTTTDTVAPVTMLNLTGLKDASGAFTSSVVCTLTATDNEGGSGVKSTLYSFEGSNWTTYTGPFTVSAAGNHTVFYRSVDQAGNQEVAMVEAFSIAGTGSATPTAQPGSGACAAMLLPLLLVGFAGIYGIRKRQ